MSRHRLHSLPLPQHSVSPLFSVLVASDTWALTRPLHLRIRPFFRVTVPSGFVTDLASIPRIFRPVLSPSGIYAAPAVVHDWCYRVLVPSGTISRTMADALLLEGMYAVFTPRWQREIIYLGVRVGGKAAVGNPAYIMDVRRWQSAGAVLGEWKRFCRRTRNVVVA